MSVAGPIVKSNDRLVSVHFDSILDLIHYEEEGRNKEYFKKYTDRSKRDMSGWYGHTNRNVGEVIDHALAGDQQLCDELMIRVREFDRWLNMTDFKQHVKVVRRKLVRDRFGDEFDIHKMYSGGLDKAFTKRIRIEADQEHRLVTLFVNFGGLASVECKNSLWRTVVALKIFDELQKGGKSVKIIVGGTSNGTFARDHRQCSYSMTVKDYNQGLSLERLAAMTHVGFYRVLGFAAKCAQDIATVMGGMGSTTNISDDRLPINLQEEVAKGHTKIVYIDKSVSQTDAERDLKKVYAQLKSMSE